MCRIQLCGYPYLHIQVIVDDYILTAHPWIFTKWGDNTLVLCSRVVKVCSKIANIAELWIIEKEEPSTTDSLQRRKV